MSCSFTVIGATANPWSDFAKTLHDQMYPDFATGYSARIAVLLVVLVGVILVSFLYLFVTIRDMRRKGRSVWLIKLVERPAGRYLAIHHHLSYPLFSIALAAVWISYAAYMHGMFGPAKGNPRHLFFFLTLGYLPFLCLMSTTTFSTTSAANLVSRGSKPNTHRLGPVASASIFVVLVPVLLGVVVGTGIWTGMLWEKFATAWQASHDYLLEQAQSYDGTLDEAAVAKASVLLLTRCMSVPPFQHAQYATSLIYVVVASVLIVLNLFAGLYLVSSLRQTDGNDGVVPRGTRLVAPLQPFPSHKTEDDETYADLASTDGPVAAWERDEQSKMKLHRLRWDVLLFFLSVVPSCMAFIGYQAWMGKKFVTIFTNAGLLEFALIGPIWIFSTLSLVCLSALTIKTILSLRRAKKWQPEDSQVAYWKSPGSVSARHLQPNLQQLQQSTQVESWRSEGAVPSRTGTPLGMERR